MKNFQFWALLLGATVIALLEVSQIFLQRSVYTQQRTLVDNQETITTGPAYQNAWRQLSVHIYQAGKTDPALATVLKSEKVTITTQAPPAAPAGSKLPAPNTLPGPRPAGQ